MRVLLVILAAAAVTASACAAPAAPTTNEVSIVADDFSFEPNTIRLKVGQEVRIALRNEGQLDHELMLGRTVKTEDGRPAGYETWLLSGTQMRFERNGQPIDAMAAMGGEMEEAADIGMILVEPGGAPITLIFTVPDMPGDWEMGCFEDDGTHYVAGMKGRVIVEPR